MQPSHVRDVVLLMHLTTSWRAIAGALEEFEDVGFCRATPSDSPSAQHAIDEVRANELELCRCGLFARALSPAHLDLKRRSLVCLESIREEIAQADVPATMALVDGLEDEAVDICSKAFRRAWVHCGLEAKELFAACSAEVALQCPNGLSSEAVAAAFEFEPFGTEGFRGIPVGLLEERLAALQQHVVPQHADFHHKPHETKRRGAPKPPASDIKADDQLLARWESAKGLRSREEFCADEGITLKDFERARDRVRKRRAAE